MDEDRREFQRKLSNSLARYAKTYPSVDRRLAEIADSNDPYVVQFMDDVVAAGRRQEVSRRKWFADRFGLTEKEALVAMHLAAGGSVTGYAEHHGVSEQTVRTQLKAVFAKTGVNRQSALAGLLLSAQLPDRDGLE